MYEIRDSIARVVLNYRSNRFLTLSILGLGFLSLVGLGAGLEQAIKSPIENKDLFYYTITTLKGGAIGFGVGATYFALVRGLDYVGSRKEKGLVDLIIESRESR